MDNSEDTGLLLKAISFAAEKHRDQRRKDGKHSPYINHPIEVTRLLWEVGGVRDISVMLAALLHDTIEDTRTSPKEIQAIFGPQVLALVLEVTDDKSLPRQERKRLQVESAPHKSLGAKLIKLADKACNLDNLIASPPRGWSMAVRRDYLLWTEQVVAGLRGVNPSLESHYDRELAAGKAALGII